MARADRRAQRLRALFALVLALGLRGGFASSAHAAEVAFLEVRDLAGRRVEMEEGGRFAHVALRFGARWLHAHPLTGVSLETDLSRFGRVSAVLRHAGVPEPLPDQVVALLGRPYNAAFVWSEPKGLYCSQLVGLLLGLAPEPMTFSAGRWAAMGRLPRDEVGLSPDDVFRRLKETPGWEELAPDAGGVGAPRCGRRLRRALEESR